MLSLGCTNQEVGGRGKTLCRGWNKGSSMGDMDPFW